MANMLEWARHNREVTDAVATSLALYGSERMNEQQLAQMSPPRLAYHPRIGEVFGVDREQWKALCEAIYPSARSTEGIVMALAYCKSRGLDVMKRPCHVVAIYDKDKKRYVDTI